MKHLLLSYLVLALLTIHPIYGYEVPTNVQKRNILLEEFTGIHCGYCPQGHAIANTLLTAKPENVYVIAIHSGNYSIPGSDEPDFRTDIGDILDVELGASQAGYPCGTINRHVFSGSSIITGRADWTKNGKKIHQEDALVNLWMKSEFNGNNRELKVTVEGYYTGEVTEPSHLLNVAWTQSAIKGPQNGAAMGDEYMHQHMLRGYITQEWGDIIETPKKGEYFTRTYTYTLPNDIKGTEVKAENIEVVAFLCTDKTEVLNVTGGKPTYTNYEKPLGATLLTPMMEVKSRYAYNFFEAKLKNESNQPITSAGFQVTINGEKQDAAWEGHINAFETLPITIHASPYEIKETNEYEVKLTTINGQNITGNSLEGSFNSPLKGTPNITITLVTDLYADENTFVIRDRNGNIVKEFGPYITDTKATYEETAELELDQIYCFEITDEWGDGMQLPKGSYKIYTSNQSLVEQNFSITGFGARTFFQALSPSSISPIGIDNNTIVSFDPIHKLIEIGFKTENTGKANISIYSIAGKCLINENIQTIAGGNSKQSISAATLPMGIYLLNINQDGKETTHKMIIR